jgi:hypothetical protein
MSRCTSPRVPTLEVCPLMSFTKPYQMMNEKCMNNKSHRPSIHIVDDNSLLNVFYHCRPVLFDEDETGDDTRVLLGGDWGRERWWYVLTRVCRRWRELVLASTSHLGLCLVCTHGTPVSKMLAHSPLPASYRGLRVRRIRLRLPVSNLRRLAIAIDGPFPVLNTSM